MKKIHFDQLNFKNNNAQFLLLILNGILLSLTLFELINLENRTWYKLFAVIIYLILTLIFSKMFWFKNSVLWNKNSIVIKLNGFWGKSFKFGEINNFNFQNEILEIKKSDGTKNMFQLNTIESKSIEKLQQILTQNVR